MVDTRWLYSGLVAMMGLERLLELWISRRNEQWLRGRGAVEVGARHYPWMVVLHILFLVGSVSEAWVLRRPFVPALGLVMLSLLVASMALRYWVMITLGARWTTRVFCLPGEPVITAGPYRYLRHPNYLAVILEIFALPMVHSAWLTASVFSAANGVLLKVRILAEERALREHSDFDRQFALAAAARRGQP